MTASIETPAPKLASNQVKGLMTSVGKTLASLPRPSFHRLLIQLEKCESGSDLAKVLGRQNLPLPDRTADALVAACDSDEWEKLRGRLLVAMTHARADRMWPGS